MHDAVDILSVIENNYGDGVCENINLNELKVFLKT